MTRLDTLLMPRRGESKGEQRHSDADVDMNMLSVIVIMNKIKIADRNIYDYQYLILPSLVRCYCQPYDRVRRDG